MRLWDTRSGVAGRVLTGHTGPVESIAFSPDGCWTASVCSDGKIQLWEVDAGVLKAEKMIGRYIDNVVAFKPGCLQIASSHGDGSVQLWDDDQQLQSFQYILCSRTRRATNLRSHPVATR